MIAFPAHNRTIELHDLIIEDQEVQLFIKLLAPAHPTINGNKWFKLKYNLEEAKLKEYNTILSFGGAYSNHLAALASAGKEFGFKTIGIIRGDEDIAETNPTLLKAAQNGMLLEFVDREKYKLKNTVEFVSELKKKFGTFYLIPEGGSNLLGIHGCTELLDPADKDLDYVCCACGTGATLAGIALSLDSHKKMLGFSALKGGEFLKEEVEKYISEYKKDTALQRAGLTHPLSRGEVKIISDYHFGGYGKVKPELIEFIKTFEKQQGIQLDQVYTGKMMFGIYDLIKKGFFERGEKILAIHTGGLQSAQIIS